MGEFSTRDVGHMAKNTQTLKSESRIKFWVSILYLISTIYDIYDDTMLLKEYHMMKKLVIVKKPEASFSGTNKRQNRSESHYKESRIWKKKYLKITTIYVVNCRDKMYRRIKLL